MNQFVIQLFKQRRIIEIVEKLVAEKFNAPRYIYDPNSLKRTSK